MSKDMTTLRDWSLIWLEDGNLKRRCITTQYDCANDVKQVVETVAKIVRSRDPLFRIEQQGKRVVPVATALGNEFFHCIKVDIGEIDRQYPTHRFSPLYAVFKRHAKALRDGSTRLRAYMVDELNAAVEAIRTAARDSTLKNSMLNLQRCERGNAKKARELLAGIRKEYSKALVIRLDLEYHSEYGPGKGPQAQQVTFEEAQQHRDAFLSYLRKGPLAAHLAGYLWKLEFGFEKGHHVHLCIFFDGQCVCKDIVIADMLGAHWKNVITGGRGMHWNCNKAKEEYPECCIGMLARGDDTKWGWLENVVRYMTKVDHYVRFQAPGKSKTFGCGGPYKRNA